MTGPDSEANVQGLDAIAARLRANPLIFMGIVIAMMAVLLVFLLRNTPTSTTPAPIQSSAPTQSAASNPGPTPSPTATGAGG